MLIDAGTVNSENVALVGARNLDPPEEAFIAASGLHSGEDAVDRAIEGCSCVYVALDADSLDSSEVEAFMPEPDGLSVGEVETLFADLRQRTTLLGLGLTGLTPAERNVQPLIRFCKALGL
jgi:arginase family enzyme